MLRQTAEEAVPGARRAWLGGGFPALRHRNFRLFVVGQGISLIGFWMQSVAQGWLVFRLSGSPLALGVVASAGYLPMSLAPLAGVIADRTARHRLLMLTQTILMLLSLALGLLVWSGLVTVSLVGVFAFGVGLVSALDVPTRQAFLVEMVGPEDLPGAIAMNASIFNAARMVGPAIAGILVGVVGEAPCFLLNAASYLAVLYALARMRLPAAPPVAAGRTRADGFLSGWRYVRSRPALRNLLLLLGVVGGFGLQYNVLMPVFARRVFAAGSIGYGLLLAAGGVGAVSSALHLASRHHSRAEQRTNLLLGLCAFAAGVLGLAVSRWLGVALLLQAVAGFGMIRYTATTNTLLQLLVDDRYRGRVMGFHTVMFLGTAPLGSLVLGAIAERFGARAAALVSGNVALLAAGWLAIRLRRLSLRERASESGS